MDHKGTARRDRGGQGRRALPLREELEGRFPDDAIHGEEEDDKPGVSGRRWIIDPIDGTRPSPGRALYCNLLALGTGTAWPSA